MRRNHAGFGALNFLAEWTGLEPATPGVTGRYSNQLNYHSAWDEFNIVFPQYPSFIKLALAFRQEIQILSFD